jgi:ABC-type multidrug transport system fused ATPase/permease subunit
LILDEATNALDSLSEELIQHTLDSLRRDRTVVVIAHRLSTVERADQVLVFDAGRVHEQGKLADLAHASGLFAKLYELQRGTAAPRRAETT